MVHLTHTKYKEIIEVMLYDYVLERERERERERAKSLRLLS